MPSHTRLACLRWMNDNRSIIVMRRWLIQKHEVLGATVGVFSIRDGPRLGMDYVVSAMKKILNELAGCSGTQQRQKFDSTLPVGCPKVFSDRTKKQVCVNLLIKPVYQVLFRNKSMCRF